MPSGTIAPPIRHQFFDANGNPLAGGKLYCYKAGTSITEPVYQDRLLASAHPQPAELDSDGYITLFLSATSYRFVLHDANDVAVPGWDIDGVSALLGVGGSSGLDLTIVAGEALAINDGCYQSDGGDGGVAGRWYRTDADDPLKSVVPTEVAFATAAIAQGAEGQARRLGLLDGFVGLTAGASYFISTVTGGLVTPAPANGRRMGVAKDPTTLVVDPVDLDPNVAAGLVFFPLGGTALQEVSANAYLAGATYDKLAPNSGVVNLDAKNAGGVWKLEAILVAEGGATASLELVNLTDASDVAVVTITSVSATGQKVQSAAIVFAAAGAAKDYAVKLKTSDVTKRVWAWAIRLVRVQ